MYIQLNIKNNKGKLTNINDGISVQFSISDIVGIVINMDVRYQYMFTVQNIKIN